ncbi:putative DsbA family dithiol-disulfide isomerase [Krasilnikovia cinnamomea]|uniref:Putative DsbA family dithiol-disulfide isomerase n=1 Tax=Krasilnikovia cinnamomea TaxID=349313 RepID=A0A4Q7ZJD5_9ACTN|nr:DsbA family oxidoreductase [Krasilnikovia cinnamomea]RZU50988.1 putative DsbA family dithiol-disulfide isomerase [Krasilnikovia cinnamomea]
MDIQVWSDIVCPWCYLGKRRLERALAEFGAHASVTFRAYQLDRAPVPAPVPLKSVLAARFGGPARVERMWAQFNQVAAAEGLIVEFERAVAANTFDAHRLVAWAGHQGRQAAMLDAVQRAHFADGIDIGSHPALAGLAASIGLDGAEALAYLGSGAGAEQVQADQLAADRLGITSVPTFVVDGRYALQGAQEPAVLRTAFEEVLRREAVDSRR